MSLSPSLLLFPALLRKTKHLHGEGAGLQRSDQAGASQAPSAPGWADHCCSLAVTPPKPEPIWWGCHVPDWDSICLPSKKDRKYHPSNTGDLHTEFTNYGNARLNEGVWTAVRISSGLAQVPALFLLTDVRADKTKRYVELCAISTLPSPQQWCPTMLVAQPEAARGPPNWS